MTLDEQYPTAHRLFQTGDGFIKVKTKIKCAHCGRPTLWYHRPLALQLCSRECYNGYVNRFCSVGISEFLMECR